jgi:hypothetical protein
MRPHFKKQKTKCHSPALQPCHTKHLADVGVKLAGPADNLMGVSNAFVKMRTLTTTFIH